MTTSRRIVIKTCEVKDQPAMDWFRDHWELLPFDMLACVVRQEDSRRGDCRFIDIGVGPCRGDRGRERIVAPQADGFYITLYHGGVLDFTTNGQDHRLVAGDMLIWNPALPSRFESSVGSCGLTIHFPHAMVKRRLGAIDLVRGFRADRDDPRSFLLRSHLANLYAIVEQVAEDHLGELLDATLELAYSCAIRQTLPAKAQKRQVLLAGIRADIAEHIGLTGLSPSDTARRLGIGVRQLQESLSAMGMTYSGLLHAERMDRASAMLRSPGRGQPVQEIALCLGYYDAAHFSNAFRRSYGMSPRQYRKIH